MKTIPKVPATQNIEELQKLTGLICECIQPEMVILLGHYAGMKISSILKGYELLILTKNNPKLSYRELLHYLNLHNNPEERKEKYIAIYLFTTDFVRQMSPQSYFFTSARREGILLYQSENCDLKERTKYKPTRVYQNIRKDVETSLTTGKFILTDAIRHQESQHYRLAAFYLYLATIQFIRAVSLVHYGFIPDENEELSIAYSKIRYCSQELSDLWEKSGKLTSIQMFGRLLSYYHHTKMEKFFIKHSDTLPEYVDKLQDLEKASEMFCTERLHFLEKLQY